MQSGAVTAQFSHPNGVLYRGDTLEWLHSIQDNSVDLVVADAPYNIKKAEWDDLGTIHEYAGWCEQWLIHVSRCLKPTGSAYVFGFSEILAEVKHIAAPYFDGCRWLVWHYRNKANLQNDWGRSHESILHFRKTSAFKLNVDGVRTPYGAHTLKYPARVQAASSAYAGLSASKVWSPNPNGAKPKDVIDIPTTCNGMGEKTPHPTQKPEELIRKLVLGASKRGDLVLDPFSGSGTTAVVAEQLGRKWLACDLNAKYNEWTIARLATVKHHSDEEWIAFDRKVAQRRESIR